MNDFLKGLALSMARSAEAQSSLPAPTQEQIDASRQFMFGANPPVMPEPLAPLPGTLRGPMSRDEFLRSPDYLNRPMGFFAAPAGQSPQDIAYGQYLDTFRTPAQNYGSVIGANGLAGLIPQTIPTGSSSSNPSIVTNIPTPGGSTANLINQLPALRGGASGESRIDPTLRPYLGLGLQRAEQLFFGEQQPTLYPGQMYVSPSQQTLDALAAQERMARGGAPTLEQSRQAFGEAMGGLSFTGMGGFLQGSPYRDLMIQAATRPILQQFEQTTLPGIQSAFSRAGRYGSGAQERAIGQATEATGRAIGDVASQLAAADYARERSLQQQALGQQIAASQVAPQIYSQQFLPSQQLAQIGAAREAIAAQPLQEAMTRYQFAQQLPYQQLQTFLSGVYGTPMAASQYASVPQTRTNTTAQTIGGLAALGGLVPERQRAQAIDYITGLLF